MHKEVCITTYLWTDNPVIHKAVCLLLTNLNQLIPQWKIM